MPYQAPPKTCPACQEVKKFKLVQDHENKTGKFTLWECANCKAQFWMPFSTTASKWYDEAYSAERVLKNLQGLKVHCEVYKKSLELFTKLDGIKILDLGCGTGEFMNELKKRGALTWGVDFSEESIKLAKRNFNFKNIYSMSFENFFKETNAPLFDVITFFEVIEHINNPLEFVKGVKKVLKPGGRIILSTPSRERIMANVASWDYPPHHLSRWNSESIANLFGKIGFKISSIYYVDQFDFILGALTEKIRMGLVAKTAVAVSKNNGRQIQSDLGKKSLVKIVHAGGYVKNYAIAGMPAVILWTIGKIFRHKNGGMLIELKPINEN